MQHPSRASWIPGDRNSAKGNWKSGVCWAGVVVVQMCASRRISWELVLSQPPDNWVTLRKLLGLPVYFLTCAYWGTSCKTDTAEHMWHLRTCLLWQDKNCHHLFWAARAEPWTSPPETYGTWCLICGHTLSLGSTQATECSATSCILYPSITDEFHTIQCCWNHVLLCPCPLSCVSWLFALTVPLGIA